MATLKPLTMAGDLILNPAEIVGPGIAILGQSGFGKSTTVRTFAEQLLTSPLPWSIMDIEDEYYTLKQLGLQVVLAGPVGNDVAEVDVKIENAAQAYKLAKRAYLERRNVVLLLGELDEDTRNEFVEAYARGLFDAGHNVATRHPHYFIVEECQEYIPQVGADKKDPCFKMLKRIAKRGRKRGIFPVWSSQRAADVDKNVLTQCQVFFLHCVTWPNDMATYGMLLPMIENLEGKLASMKAGDVFFRQGKKVHQTHVKIPFTRSPSVTPGADMAVDMERYERIADADLLQAEVTQTEAEGGVSAIPTVELRALQARVPLLEFQLSQASEQLVSITAKYNELFELSANDRDLLTEITNMRATFEDVKRERDQLATEVVPIRLIKQMIREDMNGSGSATNGNRKRNGNGHG